MWSPLFQGEALPAHELYQGRLFVQGALPDDPFLEALCSEVCVGFGVREEELRCLHETHPSEAIWSRLVALRKSWAGAPFMASLARYLAHRFDLGPPPGTPGARYRMTPPCLRLCLPGGHHHPPAAPGYGLHRDTWYALPASTLNLWVPLHAVTREETFVLYPACFARPIPNTASAFCPVRWQNDPDHAHYPEARLPPDAGRVVGVRGEAGDVFVFSAQHLHQTCPHDGPLTRVSLDVRLVCIEDEQNGTGAPTPDCPVR